jgi:hypothetical protein
VSRWLRDRDAQNRRRGFWVGVLAGIGWTLGCIFLASLLGALL